MIDSTKMYLFDNHKHSLDTNQNQNSLEIQECLKNWF